ncbi:MAG: phospholipid carrier-dependent glycosyltransferase [Acidobacteria bacterium]|nr:phospholipid carrier-dependent glycosyltransferase [Acidobacteriota bacterium]
MINHRRKRVWLATLFLLIVQATLALTMVHRESLTFDEDDHMFSGYMMWKAADYGLNPEHPPLVKLVATVPILWDHLWVPPPLHHRFFKEEAYLNGRDWLARNDGDRQHLVFEMRASAELFALGLCLFVFLAAREWFGDTAGLVALALVVFDPNVLAHSALVTTDIGVSCFFVAAIWTFYRYVTRPTIVRLLLASVATGLLLASKHSGILIGPMFISLIAWEVLMAPSTERKRTALRLTSALIAITILSVLVLWSFYGFRYAARPAGMEFSTSVAGYAARLPHFESTTVLAISRLRLLPESYLIGLIDVKRMSVAYPTFLLGKNYSHGQWYYFPFVILIKTTLGLLGLLVLATFATVTGNLLKRRELIYTVVPALIYLAVAMMAGMNIGARHLLPMYAFAIIFAAAGTVTLAGRSPRWAILCSALLVAHIVSSLIVFPNDIAYANEAWGGPRNVHNLLSDANVDWGQQLFQVKQWQDRHPDQECWFAYFARPEIDPRVYGIRCHALPTDDTQWLGGAELIAPRIQGAVLISASDLSGSEWPSAQVNPYRSFQPLHPDQTIDDSVFVYQGTFEVPELAAVSRAQQSLLLLIAKQPEAALLLARQAVALAPDNLFSETVLGDAASAVGDKQTAKAAWQAALQIAQRLEPGAQASYIPGLEANLKRLSAGR